MIIKAVCPVHNVDLEGELTLIPVDAANPTQREWVLDTSEMNCPTGDQSDQNTACAQVWLTRVIA